MMYYVIISLSSCFMILANIRYFDIFLHKSNCRKRSLFLTSSIFMEAILLLYSILTAGWYSVTKMILTIGIGISLRFLLSFFYQVRNAFFRFLAAFSFSIICLICEFISAAVLFQLIPDLSKADGLIQDSLICIFNGLLILFFIALFPLAMPRKISRLSLRYILMSAITPFFSLIITIMFGIFHTSIMEGSRPLLMVYSATLLLLNFFNAFLLSDLGRLSSLEEELHIRSYQLRMQHETYEKISEAYRDGRRIIHEIKHFNSYVLSCVENKEYEKLLSFLESYTKELEQRYIKVNTGNLVIDTFVSNYASIAKVKNIRFTWELRLDRMDISMDDHDLCIILSNLLDNSFHAYNRIAPETEPSTFFIKLLIMTKERFFVIHVENPSVPDPDRKSEDYLSHGFGIPNMKAIVEKYNGLYFQKEENGIYETTISIPISRDSLGMPLSPNSKHTHSTTSITSSST